MKVFFLIIIILQMGIVSAQQGKVEYISKYSFDAQIENSSTLYFDQTSSIFIKYHTKQKNEHEKENLSNNTPILITPEESEGFLYHRNYASEVMTLKESFHRDEMIVKDSIPSIRWNILNETKKIGSLNCQKAEGTFRGRTYQVWFTLDIPVNAGPWKLFGLPGLIIEAQDTKEEVKFIFKSLEYPTTEKIEIKAPVKGSEMSFANYKYYKENLDKYILKKMRTKLPRGASIKFENKDKNLLEKF